MDTLEPIGYKRAYAGSGEFKYLELWQGQNVIRISLGNATLDSQLNTAKWANVQESIKDHARSIQEETEYKINLRTGKITKGEL